jgi:CheY-like chemotaxis protein
MNQRTEVDRRRVPRGGRRDCDRAGRHPRVLVAESYDGVRQACVRYLERLHFDVAQAADGEEALARILEEPPRLILSEWNLPTMPAARLKQWLTQGRVGDIPVIVLASTVEIDEELPRVAGILRKPFSLVDMMLEVRRALRVP